jgi:hypothetical protein
MTIDEARSIIAKAQAKTPDQPPQSKVVEALRFLAGYFLKPV